MNKGGKRIEGVDMKLDLSADEITRLKIGSLPSLPIGRRASAS